jgi:hypothetical protein
LTEERESTIQSINNLATFAKAEVDIAAVLQESASSHTRSSKKLKEALGENKTLEVKIQWLEERVRDSDANALRMSRDCGAAD